MRRFFHLAKRPVTEAVLLPAYPENEQDTNITEGGEFLDDAIRTTDQPLDALRTEESIAPGSPQNLL